MTNEVAAVTATFEELRDLSPDNLVSQLHKVFGSITSMSADQAVAAYQLLVTIEKVAPQKEAREIAKALKEAAASRMNHLVIENGFTHTRVRMKMRFREIGVRINAPDNPF
ncbi:MAG: hypothetical protein JWN64_617 [Parcubacteria group bacterium]|nr:hypothetical protein [Parcubacteria group bacterium]